MSNSQTLFNKIVLLFALTFISAILATLFNFGCKHLFLLLNFPVAQNLWYNYLSIAIQTISIFGIPVLVWKQLYPSFSITIKPSVNLQNSLIFWLALLTWTISLIPVNGFWELNKSIPFHESLSTLENTLRNIQTANETFLKYLLTNRGSMHTVALIIVVGLFPAIFEELFFRGLLQQLLINTTSKVWFSIILTSTIFSLFHADFFAFLPRVLLGILLGVIYVASQRLWLPIIIHFINNAIGVLTQIYLTESTVESFSKFGTIKSEWIVSLVLFITLIGLFRFILIKFKPLINQHP